MPTARALRIEATTGRWHRSNHQSPLQKIAWTLTVREIEVETRPSGSRTRGPRFTDRGHDGRQYRSNHQSSQQRSLGHSLREELEVGGRRPLGRCRRETWQKQTHPEPRQRTAGGSGRSGQKPAIICRTETTRT
ncbi:hypothetical protein NDU88_001660 [Pleurodeles waltl]|uniref:Uncharacterized protein n=1 Tax=Pleurodeles waltl TaxID=8319 RepID=A0AAV7WMF1_PLEWA|nr:hypothetical protein NDU88_001660 [Pleurodeles waltl]